VLFYIPQFLQTGQGMQPFDAGLILLPEALVIAVFTPISGILYDKIGPRWPTTIGLLVAAFGAFLMSGITPDTPHSQIIIWSCVRAAGNGLAMMCIFAAGLAILPPHLVSAGGAMNNVAQRVASALGLALLVALETSTRAQLTADRSELAGDHQMALGQVGTHGFPQMYGMWGRVQLEALTDAYGNVFLVTAIATALGALSGLWLKIPKADQNAAAGAYHSADGLSVEPDRKAMAGMMH
jgi:nitrate/nitrite transporter NarK